MVTVGRVEFLVQMMCRLTLLSLLT